MASPLAEMTTSTTNPRFAAAATKSALYVFSRRQLMELSASNSSDFASDHGQRAGTQSEGCGPEAHNRVAKLNNAAQRTADICIYYHYAAPQGRAALRRGVRDTKVDADAIHRQNGLNLSVGVHKAGALLWGSLACCGRLAIGRTQRVPPAFAPDSGGRSEEHTSELPAPMYLVC